MTYEIITSLFVFAFIGGCTPGPNNIMLLASGMNYGVLRTVPHMLGIIVGFSSMVVLLGLGLSQVFESIPYSHDILKVVCTIYMLYLAWKIGTAAKPKMDNLEKGEEGSPLTFIQAVSFQWVNPKAWTMVLTAISLYSPPGHPTDSILIMALIFLIVSIVSTNLWTILGNTLRQFIQDDSKRIAFNITCAVLLVATLYPILMA